MKKLLLLLLLSACGSEREPERTGMQGSPPPGLENLAADPAPEDPARLQARVEQAMATTIPNAASAQYANVRSGAAGSVCGEVDRKQPGGRYTGFRPFVLSPEGVVLVSTTPQVLFGDAADIFPDFYIRYCASPEELSRLGPAIARGDLPQAPLPPASEAPAEAEAPPVLPPAATPPPPEPEKPKAARPASPRPTGEPDSFFNAVVRKSEDGAAK